jgi:transcriptional regulator with XRE-family HTH domain
VEFGVMTLREDDQVNGEKLRQLREALCWDLGQVARLSSLSVTQVQALESGGIDCFYSPQIKNSAARKLARVLGVSEETVLIPVQAPVALVDELSVKPPVPKPALVSFQSFHSKSHPSSWIGYFALALSLVAMMVWFGLRPSKSAGRSNAEMVATPTSLPQIVNPIETLKAQAPNENAGLLTDAPPVALVTPALTAATGQALSKPNGQEWAPAFQQEQVLAQNACPFDENFSMLEAAKPSKSSEKVSLMLHKEGMLCVQDATGKVWQEDLKPWLGRTFIGKAPWKIHSPVLPQADVYFQGEKIRLPSATSRTIALNGKEFSR